MDVLVIRGGKPLSGKISVSGSKNIALAVLSAVPLATEPVVLTNVPQISDTVHKCRLLQFFGITSHWEGSTLTLDPGEIKVGDPDVMLVRSIRTSFYTFGPLLARLHRVDLPAPGGCNIGARPVDYHLKGLAMMGATIDLKQGVYHGQVKRFKGAEIHLDMPSAGATQHLMCTATLADGMTVIRNAAMEPEIVALAEFLRSLGASVSGEGTSTITIVGKEKLGGGGIRIPADRMQAGTYLVAGAITGGDVTVEGIIREDQSAIVAKLREIGCEVHENENNESIRVVATKNRLTATNIKTMPHPGFPTDMQQPMSALLALCEGASMVEETIYESRTGHINELNRMGANIRHEGRTSVIQGVESLYGAPVVASDLRAGAALCLAGLAARGETQVRNVHFIDRGYEDVEGTLRKLGADIERIQDVESPVTETAR